MGGSGFEDSSFYPFHQIATRLAVLAMGSWFNNALLYPSINDAHHFMGEVLYRWLSFGIILAIGNHR